jgi:hypothetical protein
MDRRNLSSIFTYFDWVITYFVENSTIADISENLDNMGDLGLAICNMKALNVINE